MPKAELIDISGNKYHRLTVLRFSHMGNRRRSYWECRCDCGNIVTPPQRCLSSMLTVKSNPVAAGTEKKAQKKKGQNNRKIYKLK